MKHIDQITAVVNDNIRVYIERLVQEFGILLIGTAMPCKYVDTFLNQRCSNVILRGQRVAPRHGNVCSGMLKDCGHVCRLCL